MSGEFEQAHDQGLQRYSFGEGSCLEARSKFFRQMQYQAGLCPMSLIVQHVLHVVGSGAHLQMTGIDAPRASSLRAAMSDQEPIGDGANEQQPCCTVGKEEPSFERKTSVALTGYGSAQPAPAAIGQLLGLSEESLRGSSISSQCTAAIRAESLRGMVTMEGCAALGAGIRGQGTMIGHREASLPGVVPPAVSAVRGFLDGIVLWR